MSEDEILGNYDSLDGMKKRARYLGNVIIPTYIERAENRIVEYDGGGYGIEAPDVESNDAEMLFHFGLLAGAALERKYPAPARNQKPDTDLRSNRTLLYALAAHAAGDYPLQTDWMAKGKFDSRATRAAHVAVYTTAFLPVIKSAEWTRRQSTVFLSTIASTHFAIDSRRWNASVPIWYDQALHIIALALAFFLADFSGKEEVIE